MSKRGSSENSVLGPSAELPVADLPTLRDVLKQCKLLRERNVGVNSEYSVHKMATAAVPLVLDTWRKANAMLVDKDVRKSDKAITAMIKGAWENAYSADNSNKKAKHRFINRNFDAKLDKLFDILYCKCDFASCEDISCVKKSCDGVHIVCDCPERQKIPVIELAFIKDQREKIGSRGKLQVSYFLVSCKGPFAYYVISLGGGEGV